MPDLIPNSFVAVCVLGLQVGLLPAQQADPVSRGIAMSGTSLPPQPARAAVIEGSGSSVRIIRLSQVDGEVQMDRDIGRGYEAAYTNLPIVQQSRLKTGEGVAEVEFEDNSTLRLTPHSSVEFAELRLNSTGATVSSIRVVQGQVYVSRTGSKVNSVSLAFGAQHLLLGPSAHVALSVVEPTFRLSVLDGFATVQDPDGRAISTVTKKHSLFGDLTVQATQPVQIAGVDQSPYDTWDKSAANYHAHYANTSAFGGSGVGYGTSDLNYYGSFSDLPGCGSGWRPYFASTTWDPFASGTWAFHQGTGYSFVSPYPWGWAPFHTGLWQQCGTNGWGWHPQGQWGGLNNRGVLAAPLHEKLNQPPHAPEPGAPTLIPLRTHSPITSGLKGSDTFIFSKDSAGLGVPRQTFGKLKDVSAQVTHDGMVAAPVVAHAAFTPPQSQARDTATAHHTPTGVAAAPRASSVALGSTTSLSASHMPTSSTTYSPHTTSTTVSGAASSGTSHH